MIKPTREESRVLWDDYGQPLWNKMSMSYDLLENNPNGETPPGLYDCVLSLYTDLDDFSAIAHGDEPYSWDYDEEPELLNFVANMCDTASELDRWVKEIGEQTDPLSTTLTELLGGVKITMDILLSITEKIVKNHDQ